MSTFLADSTLKAADMTAGADKPPFMACAFTQGGLSDMMTVEAPGGGDPMKTKEIFNGLHGWFGMGGSVSAIDRQRNAVFMYTMSAGKTDIRAARWRAQVKF